MNKQPKWNILHDYTPLFLRMYFLLSLSHIQLVEKEGICLTQTLPLAIKLILSSTIY